MSQQSTPKPNHFNPYWLEQGYESRFQYFQNLMRYRVRNILLVSSLYDLYLFEEDGRLYELLREEYQQLNLSHAPEITRVSRADEALALAREERHFDLIITTLHVEDMPPHEFAKMVRKSELDIPIILLAYDQGELSELLHHFDLSVFDQVFVWQGDFRLIIAVLKQIEDKLNVDHDTRMVGVQSLLLIEDQVRYYSSFLPIIYTELFKQSQRLISEGINLSHKFLRMRARPKILLCTNYEEAWDYFSKYKDYVLGVISDIDYMRKGKPDPEAGIKFAQMVKKQHSDIPILLQSTSPENERKTYKVGASFALKGSPTLLNDLRSFMFEHFGFGDFVFRTPDGREVGRAHDLRSLEEALKTVPEESIQYHAERNHFSNWLKARTEFGLAHKLRPRKVSDFSSIQELRELLLSSLKEYRKVRQRGIIIDFDKDSFYPLSSFSRIGGGSLGGKARGLSFINKLVYNYKIDKQVEGVKIHVPPAVVIGTEVFDHFLEENDLHHFALNATDDREITKRFLDADKFPIDILKKLSEFLEVIKIPLAVRSSSLLEDSQYYPFAGVYRTYMLPNNHHDLNVRLYDLLNAIKRVYASTFYQGAKEYFKLTSYRLEEEKMAVVIQKMVGMTYGNRFYPDFSGVAKSYNFYPSGPQNSTDGIASVALGLGKTVVEGGVALKFCPKYPKLLPQFSSVEETLKNSQQEFYALVLDSQFNSLDATADTQIGSFGLDVAEQDSTLSSVGSTYSYQNHVIYDGLSRQGSRLVTFAPILKHKLFPLPEILDLLLEVGTWAMGTPVEIEFAVKVSKNKDKPHEFGILQLRPLVLKHEWEVLDVEMPETRNLVCQSDRVLGNGVVNNIHDVIAVDIKKFNRLKSRDVAEEIRRFNSKLLSQGKPYLLIGVGRWGSLDPMLGIPVKWEHIAGARVIVETGFDDFSVIPSQGSHFFHNIMSFRTGYFTVTQDNNESFVDWDWLLQQKAVAKFQYTCHLQFQNPLIVKMNGRKNRGIILKPQP